MAASLHRDHQRRAGVQPAALAAAMMTRVTAPGSEIRDRWPALTLVTCAPAWAAMAGNSAGGITLSPDGLAGDEGTFSLCTFWYAEALARAGRLGDARLTFEKMHTYANHLGLFSEEISSTGEQLGNFPQAFSHLALISAAINLNNQLDHGSTAESPVMSRAT
jgi:hypothetical protein